MTDEQFNPSDHTVDEVNAYLADADEAERQRVLEAEKADKDRSTVKAPEAPDAPQGQPELQARTLKDEGKRVPEAEGEKYEKGYDGHSPARDAGEDLTLAAVTKGA